MTIRRRMRDGGATPDAAVVARWVTSPRAARLARAPQTLRETNAVPIRLSWARQIASESRSDEMAAAS